MNKRQSRIFAIACTAFAALAFLILTVDSHRQFGKLTNADKITPAVTAGKDVWHNNNCINCHTLFGEGAYYAPDLTKIAQQRGAQYLKAYLRDPSKFYNEQRYRRLMPKQDMTDAEIADLVAFLDWVSKVDNQGWPPRPILVTGAGIAATGPPDQTAAVAKTALPPGTKPSRIDPVALGEDVFRTASPACNACHSLAPGANMAGPTLAGVGTRAQQILTSKDYKGKAKNVEGYISESIRDPSAHIVPGAMYSANGVSFMPDTYGNDLAPEQVAQLAAYLATYK